MTEWAYRATGSRVDSKTTLDLVKSDRFLCRSAFNKSRDFIGHVQHVQFGDIIHLYFSTNGVNEKLGSYKIIDRSDKKFAGVVKGTCLHIVTDNQFEKQLQSLDPALPDGEGYGPDPLVGKFVGWLVEQQTDTQTPDFPLHLFPHGFAGSIVKVR